jgi:hypothetical protein
MSNNRVKISSIVQNLVPEYVKEDYPLAVDFLRQYYRSLDSEGGVLDILQNIDKYVDVDHLVNYNDSTTLTVEVTFSDDAINVASTKGFPERWGLVKINDEIISYEKKTETQFVNCYRGFSGITSYRSQDNPEELVFEETAVAEHVVGDTVENLNANLLKEFFKKLKTLITPGFENKEFFAGLNESLFVKQSGDFYRAKGTDSSFKILFGALFGKKVEVIKPRDFLIEPSAAQYRITKDLIVEALEGDPETLVNTTLYQDPTDFLNNSSGVITKVEKIFRGNKTYYVLSLDYDYNKDITVSGSVFGEFNIHPKTKIVNAVPIGGTVIDVDSTVGFPNSGELSIDLGNGNIFIVTYGSKSVNQFYDCSGVITEIPAETNAALNVFAYGYYQSSLVKVRITGIISDLVIPKTRYYSKGDTVNISNLGYSSIDDVRLENWLYNFSIVYDVKSIEIVDESNFSYKVELFDVPSFNLGDRATIISNNGEINSQVLIEQGSVISFDDKTSFIIGGQGELDLSLTYQIRKNISKANFRNYPFVSIYNSNVQNTYFDPDDSAIYVAASSLPSYNQTQLDTKDGKIQINGFFTGEVLNIGTHYFYTGDSVTYNSFLSDSGLDNGIYFVEKVSTSEIKIARSRNDIYDGRFIEFDGQLSGTLSFTAATGDFFVNKSLSAQNIIRKIPASTEKSVNKIKTEPGYIGIFNNGVELLNYKSRDVVYFGGIESVSATSGGSGYDVITPPTITISDDVGVGATVYAAVNGSLEQIQIVDSGFDYIDSPKVVISGGNGANAAADANLISFVHNVQFSSSSGVNTSTNVITTIDNHKFREYEEVFYYSEGQTSIGGLISGASYFIDVLSSNTLKLYPTLSDAVNQTNQIDLTSVGNGNHILRAKVKKNKIQSISVKNSGSNYKNRKCVISSSGINTAANAFNIPNHLFLDKEIITYSTTGTPPTGISTTIDYYVKVVDDNNIRLAGVSTIGNQDYNYVNNFFVDISDVGSGDHIFNHKPIEVSIIGNVGVSSYSVSESLATIQPIFTGEIYSVFVHNQGSAYGSETIINYNRQPQFLIDNGSTAQVKPIISNGKIIDVIVLNSGTNYSSPPKLLITGDGSGASFTPVVNSGVLESVNVISTGGGYTEGKTFIEVVPRGAGAQFVANTKQWRIDLVNRIINSGLATEDDGFILDNLKSSSTLQYSHAYAPRKLREIALAKKISDGKIFFNADIQNDYNTQKYHSPILGWAYDGNPIYGPYGYISPEGGTINALKTGYELIPNDSRPTTFLYPVGFFVEDYAFTNSGDLDENNGRFCITPEYPNGTYAYFTTVDVSTIEDAGPFNGSRKPVFPYVIGDSFKSSPIQFNFELSSNQVDLDINETNWLRNTRYYNLFEDNSDYRFLLNPNKVKSQISKVRTINKGTIDEIQIVSGGSGYSINDKIIIDNTNTTGRSSRAVISEISGKPVSSISVAASSIENVEVLPFNGSFIGIATLPHNFNNNDLVTVTTQYEYRQIQNIGVSTNNLILSADVDPSATTGIVTYFNVSGNLSFPRLKENDIYYINNEQVKVLKVDTITSRIQVERNLNGTTGVSTYPAGTNLFERAAKVSLNVGVLTNYNYKPNREYYFTPSEALGIGTTSGIGIAHTLFFTNPGVGVTSIAIPTRTIYIPGHDIATGDVLTYNSNGGAVVSISTNGVANSSLANGTNVYAAKISNDLIGIALEKVGINSQGNFVGVANSNISLLYLTGIGTGVKHSLKTNYTGNISATVSKNIVTVVTDSDPGMRVNDFVSISCRSGITTSIKIQYNDYNRRVVANPLSFIAGQVSTIDNTITIPSHELVQGQKVIHTSSVPCGGLVNQAIYYIQFIDSNIIKLTDIPYKVGDRNIEFVDITSASFGNILPVNPPIALFKDSIIEFDLSDSSLSFTQNSVAYSAFDLVLYVDADLTNRFQSSRTTQTFEVQKTGQVGIDGNAKVTLAINDNVPNILYYNLVPTNIAITEAVKNEIIVDDLVSNHNKITIQTSKYSGQYQIKQKNPLGFTYFIEQSPEKDGYTSSNATITYTTNSPNASGSISSIRVVSKGVSYDNLPVVSVSSTAGSGAILFAASQDIGSITKVDIEDIGFDYSADLSIRPYVDFPTNLKVEPLSSFDRIGISSVGRNYTVAPDLIVIDSFTNQIVTDVELTYDLGDNEVTVLKNSNGFYNVAPRIIPINNNNGISIRDIDFNVVNKDVIVTLGASFSDPENFPFSVGDKVLIENVAVTQTTGVTGYNSKDYNYNLFELTAIDSNISGIAVTVAYNLANTIGSTEIPGTFDPLNSYGRIIAEKDFPIFDISLKKNEFFVGETAISGDSIGIVESWDKINERLKLSSTDAFTVGSIIKGKSSSSQGIINGIITYNSYYNIKPSSIVTKGWVTEKGFLSNSLQRLADNDYYQYFSYSLKSEIDISSWDETVANLNHTAGFKRFGDLQVISKADSFSGIVTSQDNGAFSSISDISSVVSTNCFYDFDLATENNIVLSDRLFSNEISFNSRILQNYIESIGNRVLTIDDISVDFNNIPRTEAFSVVETDRLTNFRSKKYITLVQDRRFTEERQVLLVDLLHDGTFSFLNQYASVGTYTDLGSFDFSIGGDEGKLEFYPIKSEFNDYNVNFSYYSINDSISGIGSTSIGNGFVVNTDYKVIPAGISTAYPIVGINSRYNKGKVVIQVSNINETYFEYNEFNYVNNGTDITFIDYGQMSTGTISVYASSGIGTYTAEASGSNVNILLKPNAGLATTFKVSSIVIGLANTSFVGVGSTQFSNSKIETFSTSIPSSGSPGVTTIANYNINEYGGSYCVVGVEDLTNNRIQLSEVVVCSGVSTASYVEYGTIESFNRLGTIGVTTTSTTVNLEFTPNPSIQTNVKVYQHAIGNYDPNRTDLVIDLTNANIQDGYGLYYGTANAIRKDFELTSGGREIFQRVFTPQSDVDLINDTIRLPEHFFVTGEKISYDPGTLGVAIGIATTSIIGIGTTNVLPSTLYIVKQNELGVKVAASASDALSSAPITLNLVSIGVGTQHTFTTTQQNSKVLISIDNVIQAPVVSLAITTLTTSPITLFEDTIDVVDSTQFFGADLIQINDEIMRVNVVGFGSTGTLLVQRPWFGTELTTHETGSLVKKVDGDYNIIGNTISFIEAPYGTIPQEDPESALNLDYTGIQTSANFSGRVFIRSGEENSLNDTYATNYVLDNISPLFTGITSIFTLQQETVDIVGISTNNAIVLVNQVLQQPTRDSAIPIEGNYDLIESGGISSIRFSGYPPSDDYDVNAGTLPKGGIIVSLGSTQGFGYQPLVSAGGTAVVSVAGTISSVSIGNTGSGYRAQPRYDVQTSTAATVGIGSTTIFLNNQNSVFQKLTLGNTGSNCTVAIGTYLQGTINGISTNRVTITGIGTTTRSIPANTPVTVTINNSSVGFINVGVALSSVGITTVTHIGVATVQSGRINSVSITNPGLAYTTSNPPVVIFDAPLSYSDLPLIYSASSPAGIGTGATVSVVVGQGSSVVNFELTNYGYAHNQNDILTVATGGLYGIPVNSSLTFNEFQITVAKTYEDEFSAWVIGDLQVIDPVDELFDGIRTLFPIEIDGERLTIRAKQGSNIDVEATLIITINDVLQVPGQGFTFDGGSTIRFTEPPKEGDTSKIFFYRGTTGVDTQFTDILAPIKAGDRVTLNSDIFDLQESTRLITEIISTDLVETNLYGGSGITRDVDLLRPVNVCQQRNDIFIDGEAVTKDREIYDYSFAPSLRLLKSLDSTSNEIFVDNARPYLSSDPEVNNSISLLSNDSWAGAAATAMVSVAGTVSTIIINDGGSGYTTAPSVTISYPIGFGSTRAARATASITSGIVTSIRVTTPGSFYTSTTPPQILIETPDIQTLTLNNLTYQGDFGVITGIASTSIAGIASIGLAFDFYIPQQSYLRDAAVVGSAITLSGIQTGYYFIIDNSNVGDAPASYSTDNSIIGIGSTYLDSVYQVAQVSTASSTIVGVGTTFIRRVVVRVSSSNFTGIITNYYGDFSWGRLSGFSGRIPGEYFAFYN